MHHRLLVCTVALACVTAASPLYAGDFTHMLQTVLTTHPALEAEREALEVNHSNVYEAYAGFFPSAQIEYGKGRQDIKFNKFPSQYQSTTNKQLTVTQPIFNGGGTIARVGGAQARETAEEFQLKLVTQQVLLRAISAYADVSEKQDVLQLSWDKVQTLTNHLKATRKQFDLGELTITDVTQSEARMARAEADLKEAQGALEIARVAYTRETGLDARSIDRQPPLPAILPNSESEITQLVDSHPALLVAKNSERAADYAVDENTANLLPRVNLQGALSDNRMISQPGLNNTNDRTLMVQVIVPIFQSGAEYARLSAARHEHAKSQHQTSDTNRQVTEAALSEWHSFTAAGKLISSYEQSTAAAEKALKSVEIERLAGTRTVLDVLNAQEELYSDRIALVQAKNRYVVGAYRLLVATGILSDARIPQNA